MKRSGLLGFYLKLRLAAAKNISIHDKTQRVPPHHGCEKRRDSPSDHMCNFDQRATQIPPPLYAYTVPIETVALVR